MKRFLVLLLCLLLALSPMALIGCGPSGDGDGGVLDGKQEEIDESKTQVFVGVQQCGVGLTFADNLDEAYEALNPNVQIIIDPMDSSGDGPSKLTTILDDRQDISFMCNFTASDFIKTNEALTLLADITDVVTAENVIGTKSIHEAMYKQDKNYHNFGTEDAPKYFSLPWFTSFMSTTYDVKLFEDNDLYYLSGYKGLDGVTSQDDQWGPDGVSGTYDDGFPATWKDMQLLLVVMKRDYNIIPFTWTAYPGYLPSWMSFVWASYEGASNYEILQTFDGTYTYKDLQGAVHTQTITEDNGYLLAAQNGKLAALKTVEYLWKNGMVTPISADASSVYGNKTTQQTYLESCETGTPIAFLNEGSYWEAEAKEYFDEMAKDDSSYAYGEREFAFFPWPKYIGSASEGIPDQINTKRTLLSGSVQDLSTAVVIKKNSQVLTEAKDFLKFAYSSQGNANFLRDSGLLRPFDYDESIITEEYFTTLTPYQRSLYTVATEENVERITGANRTGLMKEGGDYIKGMCSFNVTYGIGSYSSPLVAFRQNPDLTAEKYIEAVRSTYTQQAWIDAFFSSSK